jgi:hypothetical protein
LHVDLDRGGRWDADLTVARRLVCEQRILPVRPQVIHKRALRQAVFARPVLVFHDRWTGALARRRRRQTTIDKAPEKAF